MGGLHYIARLFWLVASVLLTVLAAYADSLSKDQLSAYVMPPYSIGDEVNDNGVWALLNSAERLPATSSKRNRLPPCPVFPAHRSTCWSCSTSMAASSTYNSFPRTNLYSSQVSAKLRSANSCTISRSLDLLAACGRHALRQRDAGGPLVYLDGVTKATASVRIAHESILAAALAVAREKMRGISTGPSAYPDPKHDESLDWNGLVSGGLVTHKTVLNREVDAAFAGTLWQDDDPVAHDDPDGVYLDLWLVDLGPPSIARAVLAKDSFDDLQAFLSVSPDDEPLLVIDAGRHGLVSRSFVRNTAPDRLSAEQDGLPVALRDADLLVELGR